MLRKSACRRTVRFCGHVSGGVGQLLECLYFPRLRQSLPRNKWMDGWMDGLIGWIDRLDGLMD